MSSQNAAEMPFLDHLEELRWRILRSLVALILGVLIAFVIMTRYDVIRILEIPIAPFLQGGKLVYTHPADPFRIVMSFSIAIGAILASPVILYQVWAFLSPALYAHEKKVMIPVLIFGAMLFLCGVALSYFVILPLTLTFLSGFQATGLQPMITARDYFDFAIGMSLALGLVFELPIAVLALTAIGIVTPMFLLKYRRHATVLCLVGSAFITPGADPFSLLALAAPLYLLYEVSVITSGWVYRRRLRKQATIAGVEGVA